MTSTPFPISHANQPTHRKQSTSSLSVSHWRFWFIHFSWMKCWGMNVLVGWLAGGSIHNIQRHILDHHDYPLHSLHLFYVVLRVFALCWRCLRRRLPSHALCIFAHKRTILKYQTNRFTRWAGSFLLGCLLCFGSIAFVQRASKVFCSLCDVVSIVYAVCIAIGDKRRQQIKCLLRWSQHERNER